MQLIGVIPAIRRYVALYGFIWRCVKLAAAIRWHGRAAAGRSLIDAFWSKVQELVPNSRASIASIRKRPFLGEPGRLWLSREDHG